MHGDLMDEEWAIISNLLLPERGRWFRPAQDNRLFVNGMLYALLPNPDTFGTDR